jgi:CHAD domain-containing protein
MIEALRRFLANDPLARLGDEEGVHQLRVGARRLRSHLRTFEPILDPSWAQALSEDLKWVGTIAGHVRDLDVLKDLFESMDDGWDELKPLYSSLETSRHERLAELNEAMRSNSYKELLEKLVTASREPRLTDAATAPCFELLPELVEGAWERLASKGRALKAASSDEEFHDVRKRAKQVRYASEAVAPAVGVRLEKEARRFAKGAEDVQNVLGAYQDAIVGVTFIRNFGGDNLQNGPLNFASGRLVERLVRRAEEQKAAFDSAWRDLDRKKFRRWLRPETA